MEAADVIPVSLCLLPRKWLLPSRFIPQRPLNMLSDRNGKAVCDFAVHLKSKPKQGRLSVSRLHDYPYCWSWVVAWSMNVWLRRGRGSGAVHHGNSDKDNTMTVWLSKAARLAKSAWPKRWKDDFRPNSEENGSNLAKQLCAPCCQGEQQQRFQWLFDVDVYSCQTEQV